MGLIREPEGIEFLVEPTKPNAKSDRELSAIIAKARRNPKQKAAEREALEILSRYQQQQSQEEREEIAVAHRKRLEAEILQLPLSERAYLLHRLVDSLTPPTPVEPAPKVALKKQVSIDASKSKRPRASKARVSS